VYGADDHRVRAEPFDAVEIDVGDWWSGAPAASAGA